MEKMIRTALVALLMAAPLAATAQTGSSQTTRGVHAGGVLVPAGGSCGVTDLVSFAQFIAGRPTISAFQAAYGCVHLVLPGDFSTRELRNDNSRYFAEVDSFGRIVGGYFQ